VQLATVVQTLQLLEQAEQRPLLSPLPTEHSWHALLPEQRRQPPGQGLQVVPEGAGKKPTRQFVQALTVQASQLAAQGLQGPVLVERK
jgi:hypothetical protein